MGSFTRWQASLVSQALEVAAPLPPDLGRPGDRLSLRRNPGMKLKGAPLDVEVVALTKLVDPILADVAVRSNEVAVNRQLRGHRLDTS